MEREKVRARLLLIITFCLVGLVSQAHAPGGVSLDQGQCLMKIGPDTMTFTGYSLKSRENNFATTYLTLDRRSSYSTLREPYAAERNSMES